MPTPTTENKQSFLVTCLRLTFGLLLGSAASYATWAFGQLMKRLLNGYWEFVPQVWLIAPTIILVNALVLFTPAVLIFAKSGSRRFYTCLGAAIALAVFLADQALLMLAIAEGILERLTSSEMPSDTELLWLGIVGLARVAIQPDGGLYAMAVGAAGGFAFSTAVGKARS